MAYCNSVQSTLILSRSKLISASWCFSLFKPHGLLNFGCHGNQKDQDFKHAVRKEVIKQNFISVVLYQENYFCDESRVFKTFIFSKK